MLRPAEEPQALKLAEHHRGQFELGYINEHVEQPA